jgi:hypothetical protein
MKRNKKSKPYHLFNMYIAYSALRETEKLSPNQSSDQQIQQRYQAYLVACAKHRRYINEIQQYHPGWMPPFR